MAKIEEGPNAEDIINVEQKVGVRGQNDPGDVAVIQAMLNYLQQFAPHWTKVTLPYPNGILDRDTQQAIFDYQQFVRNRRDELEIWVAKDGTIEPFEPVTKLLHKQQWSILAINRDCAEISALKGEPGDHIDAIVRRWPFVAGVALGLEGPLIKRIFSVPQSAETPVPAFIETRRAIADSRQPDR